MKLNILITASGSAIGQGIIKSIKGSSLNCYIVTTDSQPYAAGLYRGGAAYLIPLAKSPNYIDEIIKICNKENILGICIGTDYELIKISENKERIEKETNAKVIVSPPEIIKIANDKWLTYKFLKENNLPYIPSALCSDVETLVEEEGFPVIVKPRIGDSSKNTFIVNSKKELNEKLELLLDSTDINPYLNEKIEPIIQKCIGKEQEEYTSTTVVFDKKCYGVISMRREMKYGGHTTKALIEDFSKINKTIEKVAETLNPFGPCNFQSRLINDTPYIFEINCRFSGTIAACSQVGFNTVEACIKKVILNEELTNLKYKKGVVLRYFNEVLISQECINEMIKKRYLLNPDSEINKDL
jgi:carbamoyl-phosphate synthase large subunit